MNPRFCYAVRQNAHITAEKCVVCEKNQQQAGACTYCFTVKHNAQNILVIQQKTEVTEFQERDF